MEEGGRFPGEVDRPLCVQQGHAHARQPVVRHVRPAPTGKPLGLWPDDRYETLSVDLFPDDLGVFVTDGITEALEGTPFSLHDVLKESARSGVAEPSDLCAYLLRVARMAPGPPGAGDWQDDRTSLSFRVLHSR